MTESSLPFQYVQHDCVALDGRVPLRRAPEALRATDASSGRRCVVVPLTPDRYAVVFDDVLHALIRLLSSALNRHLAEALLDAPLGDLLANLAMPARDAQQTTAGEIALPCVVVQAGRPIGVWGMPKVRSAEALLEAIGLSLWQLNEQATAEAAPPTDDAPSDEPAGRGPDRSEAGAMEEMAEGAKDAFDEQGDRSAEPESPRPTSPPDPTPGRLKEAIRLDVASPETAVVNEPFDLAVAIRQPSSPPLRVEDLNRVWSAEGVVYREADAEIIRYRVEIEAKDCDIEPSHYVFLLERGKDSIVQFFQLTPRREGMISIIVNAYQADDDVLAATTRVRLKAIVRVLDPAAGATSFATGGDVSPQADLAIRLYELLRSDRFSRDDLHDLAFRLAVPWDDLDGQTQSAKARALVQYLRQRGRLDQLCALLKAERPDLEI